MNIPDGKYLGKLCKRGHDWHNTGKSLKYYANNTCVICNKEYSRELWRKNHPGFRPQAKPIRVNKCTYLGTLCKKHHNYKNTGMSLRTNSGDCIECEKERRKANIEKIREINKRASAKYKRTPRGKQIEIECSKRYYQKVKNTTEFKVKQRIGIKRRQRRARASLYGSYIKTTLQKQHGVPRELISDELIELKRIQLIAYRASHNQDGE